MSVLSLSLCSRFAVEHWCFVTATTTTTAVKDKLLLKLNVDLHMWESKLLRLRCAVRTNECEFVADEITAALNKTLRDFEENVRWVLANIKLRVSFIVFKVITCLENLKMSGNLTAVGETSGSWPKFHEVSGKKILSGKTVCC